MISRISYLFIYLFNEVSFKAQKILILVLGEGEVLGLLRDREKWLHQPVGPKDKT